METSPVQALVGRRLSKQRLWPSVAGTKTGGGGGVLPVEGHPQIADPLHQPGHLPLFCRSPPEVDDADATQGQQPGQRRLIVVEDVEEVGCGHLKRGVPILPF